VSTTFTDIYIYIYSVYVILLAVLVTFHAWSIVYSFYTTGRSLSEAPNIREPVKNKSGTRNLKQISIHTHINVDAANSLSTNQDSKA